MTEPLQATPLEDGQLFSIAFVVGDLFFPVCQEDSSQVSVIEYSQPPDFLIPQRIQNGCGANCNAKVGNLWVLISSCSHGTRQSCKNALWSLSIPVVTSSFARSFDRKTDPRYLSDGTFVRRWWKVVEHLELWSSRRLSVRIYFDAHFCRVLPEWWLENHRAQRSFPQTSDLWCRLVQIGLVFRKSSRRCQSMVSLVIAYRSTAFLGNG